jgi:hypothetical protein
VRVQAGQLEVLRGASTRAIASRASSRPKPNLESAWPVEIAACVSPATSGVMRS